MQSPSHIPSNPPPFLPSIIIKFCEPFVSIKISSIPNRLIITTFRHSSPLLWEQGVVGSNPVAPTFDKPLIIRYL